MKTSTFETFSEKEVINCHDGKILGTPCDIKFNTETGNIISFSVRDTSKFSFCGNKNTIEIFWDKITKIGDDIILVDLNCTTACHCEKPKKEKKYFFGG
ncbi:MAG: YlmC/YmxH family sporulation protein [Clostridia bacterium]|nr:YlmC/YmxH family sporulation protein [Clostridia bacterium]